MYGLCVCVSNNVSFLSYFLTFTPCVNGFAELPALLVSEQIYTEFVYVYIYK